MYYTYILRFADKSYYIGYSKNLTQRIAEHERGGVTATKYRGKFRLAFYAAFQTKNLALNFEQYLKSSSGFAFRNKHFL